MCSPFIVPTFERQTSYETEEEEKVIEEVRKTGKQWMGETSMDEVKKPEPEPADGERVNLKINQVPAITFLEGKLPRVMLDELNAHVDEHRAKMEDYSGNLVGQIKQTTGRRSHHGGN